MKKYILVFFFFLSVSATAQDVILLKGKIVSDSLDSSAINIVNLTKELGTTNNALGDFEIETSVGDTLLFSSVQYEVREIMISQEIFKTGFLRVELFYMMNELEEVSLSNISLSGNLNNDLSNIETFNQASVGFPMSPKTRPTSIQRKIYTASSSSLGLIINTLNGRLKMLKKAEAMMEYESLIDLGVDIFPTEFFTDNIHIPKNKIRLFIYYCAEDPRFKNLLIQRDALEIIEYYLEKAQEFKELHKREIEEGQIDTVLNTDLKQPQK